MYVAIALFLVGFATGYPDKMLRGVGPNEAEFEEIFNKPKLDPNSDEYKAKDAALKKNEAQIAANNAANTGWKETINEMTDLTDAEFKAEKTGMTGKTMRYGRGLVLSDTPYYDEEAERYFDTFRNSRATLPASYSAVTAGLVSPVKDQGECGSCVAFANMALIETCFKKVSGVFGDYSEQHLLDCGYGKYDANGCNGADMASYLKFATANAKAGKGLYSETVYPYKAKKQTCKTGLTYATGPKVTGHTAYTTDGTEALLKKLVYAHGAVTAGVFADNALGAYKSGVYKGCKATAQPNHAITVVGYGTESGVDYWLIKNSWGSSWGAKGYFKLKRGTNMCGIGKQMAVTTCAKSGTTATTTKTTTKAPTTTTKASTTCADLEPDCKDWVTPYCKEDFAKWICPKTCKKCT
jgi:C1A family cysteine protease